MGLKISNATLHSLPAQAKHARQHPPPRFFDPRLPAASLPQDVTPESCGNSRACLGAPSVSAAYCCAEGHSSTVEKCNFALHRKLNIYRDLPAFAAAHGTAVTFNRRKRSGTLPIRVLSLTLSVVASLTSTVVLAVLKESDSAGDREPALCTS